MASQDLGSVGQDGGALAIRVGVGAGRTAGGDTQAQWFSVALRLDGPSSRPALRTPLLVDWHHLVPPDDSCLPPRRLRFNQVSKTDKESEGPRQKGPIKHLHLCVMVSLKVFLSQFTCGFY